MMFRKSLLGVKSRSGATQRKPQQEKPGQQQQQQEQQAAPPPASSKLTQLRGNNTGKQEEGTKQVLDRRQHNQLQVRYFRYF